MCTGNKITRIFRSNSIFHLEVKRSTLKIIRLETGSQCSFLITGAMCPYLHLQVTILVAEFSIYFSLLMRPTCSALAQSSLVEIKTSKDMHHSISSYLSKVLTHFSKIFNVIIRFVDLIIYFLLTGEALIKSFTLVVHMTTYLNKSVSYSYTWKMRPGSIPRENNRILMCMHFIKRKEKN